MLEKPKVLEKQKTETIDLREGTKLNYLLKIDKIVFKATGHHLPKGVPQDAEFCTLANAFERDVVMGWFSFPNTSGEERSKLREFFRRFDAREFPELIWNGRYPNDNASYGEKSMFRHERQREADRLWTK